MRKNIKFFIVGETNSGKDTLARRLAKDLGLEVLASYTDNPKRADQTEGVEHRFVSKEYMSQILDTEEIFAYTETIGARYCATVSQVKECDLYVINPDGLINTDKKNLALLEHRIIFLDVDKSIRKQRSIARGDDLQSFENRCKKEQEEFDKFREEGKYDLRLQNYSHDKGYDIVKNYITSVLNY